jgi:hypothetical protein
MTEYKSKFGYMCRTNFLHELGEAPGGVEVYASVKDTLNHCFCAKSCGIAKLEIFYQEDVLDGDSSGSMFFDDIENKTPKYIQSQKQSIEHYRKQADFYQKRATALVARADKMESGLPKEKEEPKKEKEKESNTCNTWGSITRLFSTNNNLRTDFVYGEFNKLPEIDSPFILIAKPLTEGSDSRLIHTTSISKIWNTSLDGFPVVLFKTENSLYALYVNEELTEWPSTHLKKKPTVNPQQD